MSTVDTETVLGHFIVSDDVERSRRFYTDVLGGRAVVPGAAANAARPRLIEEHHVIGPDGEDELEATDDRGRRWYHLRPEPRRRADLIGFNYTWWIAIWFLFILIAFLPWGRGWGY